MPLKNFNPKLKKSDTIVFRKYQKKIIKAQNAFMQSKTEYRGLIYAATGAGKTEIFMDLMLRQFASDIPKRILVVHPRIALSHDQQGRFRSRFHGLEVEFTSFHSGGQKYHTLPDRKNISTTSRQQLQEVMALGERPHITFSSYESLHKIADLNWDLVICDEAHEIVRPHIRPCLHLFRSDVKVLFYTGTPVSVPVHEESMDNPELFGRILAAVPPKQLIPSRYIVPPRIRALNVLSDGKGNAEDYVAAISAAFVDQLSFAHPKFNHKMLVAMPNTKFFSDISGDIDEIRGLTGNPELDVYYVTASTAVKNGTRNMDRERLLEDFAHTKNNAIIMHCDTLAEGIDVDGIGGILIMRELGKVKTIQTIGRGCRPAKADIRLKGKRKGEVRKKRIKKECIVHIPCFDGEWGGDVNLEKYAEIFKEAGYNESDFWTELEFQAPVGVAEDLGIPRDIEYKEAVSIISTEGLNHRFWDLFAEEVETDPLKVLDEIGAQ